MAEFSGTIVGVISLGIQVIQGLVNYYTAFKDRKHFHLLAERAQFLSLLNGFAGRGKSVFLSTIIQYTFRYWRSNPRIGIAFFYFTFTDLSSQDASSMLRALILQLVAQLGGQDALAAQLYERYRNATPPDHALLDCLRGLIRKFEHVYFVVDALDESPWETHRDGVLQALNGYTTMEPPAHQIVPLATNSVGPDIASFVSGHLRSNRRLRKWEKHYDQIEKALIKGADGVFRWVECQFTALERWPSTKARLDGLLGSLPRTLDATYERMLLSIDEESADEAKRILNLPCVALVPFDGRGNYRCTRR
ncbi:hypothetical protein C8A03DRAFT_32292 [Achaetomium macrosporum]|uniref:Nephrocystin 3-like N-terminal domain-containing protein n=1 Tax=Achaetomium macrosporum TaxID=79813 RepID=A0AAN7HDG9_9PEZI|nr:hypothetical protein C8A03DRAFT_32292 [Achaetomium macrosporum]